MPQVEQDIFRFDLRGAGEVEQVKSIPQAVEHMPKGLDQEPDLVRGTGVNRAP